MITIAMSLAVVTLLCLAYLWRQHQRQSELIDDMLLQEKKAAKQLYPHHEPVRRPVRRRSDCEVQQ